MLLTELIDLALTAHQSYQLYDGRVNIKEVETMLSTFSLTAEWAISKFV
jgi:hypothetical protein